MSLPCTSHRSSPDRGASFPIPGILVAHLATLGRICQPVERHLGPWYIAFVGPHPLTFHFSYTDVTDGLGGPGLGAWVQLSPPSPPSVLHTGPGGGWLCSLQLPPPAAGGSEQGTSSIGSQGGGCLEEPPDPAWRISGETGQHKAPVQPLTPSIHQPQSQATTSTFQATFIQWDRPEGGRSSSSPTPTDQSPSEPGSASRHWWDLNGLVSLKGEEEEEMWRGGMGKGKA